MTIKEFINEAPFGGSFTEVMDFLQENGFHIYSPEDDLFPTALEFDFDGFDEEYDETMDGCIGATVHVFLTDSVIDTIREAYDTDDEDAIEAAEELEEEIKDLALNELWDDLEDYVESCYILVSGDGDFDVEIDRKHSGITDKEYWRLTDR